MATPPTPAPLVPPVAVAIPPPPPLPPLAAVVEPLLLHPPPAAPAANNNTEAMTPIRFRSIISRYLPRLSCGRPHITNVRNFGKIVVYGTLRTTLAKPKTVRRRTGAKGIGQPLIFTD
jgi:hypothetical protein